MTETIDHDDGQQAARRFIVPQPFVEIIFQDGRREFERSLRSLEHCQDFARSIVRRTEVLQAIVYDVRSVSYSTSFKG